MLRGWGSGRTAAVGQHLVMLALLPFLLLRVLIPAGFMPNLAGHDGWFEVVICDGHGTRTALVDAEGRLVDKTDDKPAKPGEGKAGNCPFGLAFAQSFLPLTSGDGAIAPMIRSADAVAPNSDHLLLPPAQGPPLGPRAPPIFLL